MKTNVKIDLSGLEKIQKKLKKYEQPTRMILPYTQDQWDEMTDYEKEQAKQQAVNEYKENIIKDLNK